MRICYEIECQTEIASRLDLLGGVALDLGEYQQAQQYYQEGLAISREIGDLLEIPAALSGLGEAACGLGDFQAARAYLYEALKSSLKAGIFAFTARALVSLATLFLQEEALRAQAGLAGRGQQERVVELLALALRQPGGWQVYKDRATRLLAELAVELPPEVMATAQACSQTRKLEEVISWI